MRLSVKTKWSHDGRRWLKRALIINKVPKNLCEAFKMSKSTSNDEGAFELVQRSGPYSIGTGKSDGEVKVHDVDNDVESDQIASSSNSAYDDIRGMQRMGKEQQFSRNFRQLSLTAFVSLATASWEIGLFIISPALVDGGRAGLVWSSLWCWIGFAPIYLSMVRLPLSKLRSYRRTSLLQQLG